MKRTNRLVTRAVFSLGVLASLGFGAAQAVASPSGASRGGSCDARDCDRYCRLGGAEFGRCQVNDETGNQYCMCFYM